MQVQFRQYPVDVIKRLNKLTGDVVNDIVTIKKNGTENKLKIYLKELGNYDYNLIQCENIIFLLEIQSGNVIALTDNEKYTFYNRYKKS